MALFLAVTLIMLSASAEFPPSPPPFSWDTVPLFIHAGNISGPLNDTAAKYMSSFPIATLPHSQAGPDGQIKFCNASTNMICEEDALLLALKSIRSYNGDTRTLFYLNTLLNFPWYNLSNAFNGENEKYLLHYDGKLIFYADCHKGAVNVTMFDMSKNETRILWLNTIQYAMTKYPGVVDGTYSGIISVLKFFESDLIKMSQVSLLIVGELNYKLMLDVMIGANNKLMLGIMAMFR